MDFVKGTIIGIVAGTIVGTMNSSSIMGMVFKGKRQIKRMRRKYNI